MSRLISVCLSYLGSNLMEAGSDTTAIFLQSFITYITAFPEVQKCAQAEIDEVIGQSRSPTFEDWESLPYVQAIIKEVGLWRFWSRTLRSPSIISRYIGFDL